MSTEEVDQLLASLKIVARVARGQRLSTHNGHLSIDNNVRAQPVMRWIQGDSRDSTLAVLRSIVTTSMRVARDLVRNDPPIEMREWALRSLLESLSESIGGLQNLKHTYASDASTAAHFEVLIARVNAHCTDLVKHVPSATPKSAVKTEDAVREHEADQDVDAVA
jgi:hypothetical protein